MQRAKLLMTMDAENPGEKLAAVQQPIDHGEALKEQVTTPTKQMYAMATN